MDYHIYLHSVNSGGTIKPTEPRNEKSTPKPTETTSISFFGSAKNFVTGVRKYSSGAGAKAMGVLGKVIPAFAVMAAIIKVADTVFEYALPFYTTTTGNYYVKENRDMMKVRIGMIFNPVETIYSFNIADTQRRVANRNAETNRILTGDTLINYNYGSRGRRLWDFTWEIKR